VPNHALQQKIIDLNKAYQKFFSGEGGYPKKKSKIGRQTFRYPDPKQFRIENGQIFLPKAGLVKFIQHRPLQGKMKTATVSFEAGEWYVSVQCEVTIAEPVAGSDVAVGIDINVLKPMVFSTREVIMLPRTTPMERKKLATLQQKVARCKKGSNNRRKAVRRVARHHARLARRRRDAAHKATTYAAKNFGAIMLEDLKVKNMTASAAGTIEEPGKNVAQKAGLNRSILDIAPHQIRSMCEYKAIWYGSKVVIVPAPYTSQECSKCHYTHADNRKTQSEFLCLSCGHADNADFNASDNIRAGGLPVMACESRRAKRPETGKTSSRGEGSSALQGREKSRPSSGQWLPAADA
jgi:putative transposase